MYVSLAFVLYRRCQSCSRVDIVVFYFLVLFCSFSSDRGFHSSVDEWNHKSNRCTGFLAISRWNWKTYVVSEDGCGWIKFVIVRGIFHDFTRFYTIIANLIWEWVDECFYCIDCNVPHSSSLNSLFCHSLQRCQLEMAKFRCSINR